ncbi:c-type cytochrome [Planctomicrobium sp. SH668]|uniref:c-type cytochrome n=1 Tax=Planctomicrobium sp. SH668 TaxID=3448126 RepID=UPI003F5C9F95
MFLRQREIQAASKSLPSGKNHSSMKSWSVTALLMSAQLFLVGCTQEMANQGRVDTMEPHKVEFLTPDRRTPVPGTIARGQDYLVTPVNSGREGEQLLAKIPVPVTPELLARGQQRYNIFCSGCHGATGQGDGLVVQRGFPAPPSYHIDRLRDVPDGHLFVTIKEGVGRMPRFGNRIPSEDRWAIAAYVRALQLSQNATTDELNQSDLDHLK